MLDPKHDGKMAKAGLLPHQKPNLDKRLREYRKEKGLVEVRLWVTPTQRDLLQAEYPKPVLVQRVTYEKIGSDE